MTFKEKLLEYTKIANEKATLIERIEADLKHDGFHQYSALDYKVAYDAHAEAINNHGELVSRMAKEGFSPNNEYIE